MSIMLSKAKIDVSIIIVNWNTKQLLLDCLESLIRETTRTTIEIIVVDNGSNDGSAEAVKKLFPDVKLILNNANLGFAKANNIGIRQSIGRYVCLVNSDIKALESCVDRMFEYMDNNPSIAALGPKTVNEDLSFRLNCREFPSLWKSFCEALALNKLFPKSTLFRGRLIANITVDKPCRVDVLSGCFLMVRRKAIEQVGILDERFFIYGEDRDWCKRFKNFGWDVVFFPGSIAIHYGGASSSASPIEFIVHMITSDFKYWDKFHTKTARAVYYLIILFHYIVRVIGLGCAHPFKSSDKSASLCLIKKNAACLRWILNNIIKIIYKE